jgi:alanyl-tRNA synthetase
MRIKVLIWQYLPEDRVLKGSMKDNFWEMGETGVSVTVQNTT